MRGRRQQTEHVGESVGLIPFFYSDVDLCSEPISTLLVSPQTLPSTEGGKSEIDVAPEPLPSSKAYPAPSQRLELGSRMGES